MSDLMSYFKAQIEGGDAPGDDADADTATGRTPFPRRYMSAAEEIAVEEEREDLEPAGAAMTPQAFYEQQLGIDTRTPPSLSEIGAAVEASGVDPVDWFGEAVDAAPGRWAEIAQANGWPTYTPRPSLGDLPRDLQAVIAQRQLDDRIARAKRERGR